jgi:hypothetical protein
MSDKSNLEILKRAAKGEVDAIVWLFNSFVFKYTYKPFDVYEGFQERLRDAKTNNWMLALVLMVLAAVSLPVSKQINPEFLKIMWYVGLGFIISAGAVLLVGTSQRASLCGNEKRMEKVRKNAQSMEEQKLAKFFEWEVQFISLCRAVLEAFDLETWKQEMKDPIAFQKMIYHNLSCEFLIEHICREHHQFGVPSDIYDENHTRLIKKIDAAKEIGMRIPEFMELLDVPKPEGWFREPAKFRDEIYAVLEKSGMQNPD